MDHLLVGLLKITLEILNQRLLLREAFRLIGELFKGLKDRCQLRLNLLEVNLSKPTLIGEFNLHLLRQPLGYPTHVSVFIGDNELLVRLNWDYEGLNLKALVDVRRQFDRQAALEDVAVFSLREDASEIVKEA